MLRQKMKLPNNLFTNLIKPNYSDKFTHLSLIFIAISVNLGVALVSISSLLIVLAALFQYASIKLNNHKELLPAYHDSATKQKTYTIFAILASLIWIGITGIWTESNTHDALIQYLRYSRILTIPIVFYIAKSPGENLKIIKIWIATQVFVITSSYLLWLGIDLPWVINEHAMRDLTPFTSTLEQPIMNTVTFLVAWYFREDLIKSWGKIAVWSLLAATLFEVFFIMMGRTGFLTMIIALTMIAWWTLNPRIKLIAIILPFILFIGLNNTSPIFKTKFQEVLEDVASYKSGRTDTSQGNRIDFTVRSIQAIKLRPLLGYGVGSWPIAYKIALNGEQGKEGADNPHEQYLLWFVEGGVVAFALLLSIYASILKDSFNLNYRSQKAIITIAIMLILIGFLNCPLHGAGMSEYFCLAIALLLRDQKSVKDS